MITPNEGQYTRAERDSRGAAETREAAYWDDLAGRLSVADLHLDGSAEQAVGRRRLELLADLRGQRVLDVGCGTGLWSVLLAQRGAEVWAIDISPQSIAVTQCRAEIHEVEGRIHPAVMSATELDYPDGFFDCVHGQDIIHHVDPRLLGQEVARVLAPAGTAVFVENCANNRLLMLAREWLPGRWGIPKWSSEDEYPLTRARLEHFAQFFARTHVEYPAFVFFHLVDAYVFRFRHRGVSRLCTGMDGAVHRCLPYLRPYSYRQLIHCRTAAQRLATGRSGAGC